MITVIGSINLDLTASAERLPVPGETLTGTDFAMAAGGKGANQALAALRAGAGMRLIGAVGTDGFAAPALAELKAEGADLSGITPLDANTGVALILVGGSGENVIVVVPGANGFLDEDMARAAVNAMAAGDHLLLQQEIPAESNRAALRAARRRGVISLINIAPYSEASPALAELADIVIANETEFGGLLGAERTGEALAAALQSHARDKAKTMIVTLGADGAMAATPEGDFFTVPAPTITPVDTVGAGDTFCGYLAASLDGGMPLEDALRRAAKAGALACLKAGAQPAIPHAREVNGAGARMSWPR